MFNRILKIKPEESRTFVLHMIYSVIDGLVLGIFALNEYILIKSLKGTNYQIAFLVQSTVIVLSFSMLFNIIFRRIQRKGRFIRYAGIITRLPLFLFFFFPVEALTAQNAFFTR
jgi:hypothetical protein